MRQSWDENGSTVIASAKFALNQLKNLGGDVGKTCITVWDKEGYGKADTDDLLISVSNLLFTIGNLADGLDQAWKSGAKSIARATNLCLRRICASLFSARISSL